MLNIACWKSTMTLLENGVILQQGSVQTNSFLLKFHYTKVKRVLWISVGTGRVWINGPRNANRSLIVKLRFNFDMNNNWASEKQSHIGFGKKWNTLYLLYYNQTHRGDWLGD